MSNVQVSGNGNSVITAGGDVVLGSSAPAQISDNGASMPLPPSRPSADRIRILFLGANSTQEPLDLEREVSRIEQDLRMARERDSLEFRQVGAVTSDTLMQAMLDEAPSIVHFAGHGTTEGILLRDEVGNPRLVTGEALASLFALFRETVKCVVLNACWSETQAHAIRRHVPYVIGTRAGIPDAAALAFSAGFYKAIGAGKDVPFAFEAGNARVHMEGCSGEDLLVLL
jgi:CHAT domain-containing protein